jgi:hypothetical protein
MLEKEVYGIRRKWGVVLHLNSPKELEQAVSISAF